MRRRDFIAATAALLPTRARAKPSRQVLFVCVDGCGPEYIQASDVPNLRRMIGAGAYVEGTDMVPTVTNINVASLVTGTFPSEHGITANYIYNRASGKNEFMEAPALLLRPTIFEKARRNGYRTAFVCVKDKLLKMLGQSADLACSAENAPRFLQDKAGPAEAIYSAAINHWALRAVRYLLKDGGYNFVFLTTTDYMMHTHAPNDAASLAHMHELDRLLGAIMDDNPNLELYLTADHGMNAKPRALDLTRLLAQAKLPGRAVSLINDRYVAHHASLGGAAYIYFDNLAPVRDAIALLKQTRGVDRVFTQVQAAEQFHLMKGRIGDLLVLGARDTAFGDLQAMEESTTIRSHGSLHESKVPILCYGRKVTASDYQYNFDIARRFSWDIS
jgi:phosphonoacetate hydrolase